MIKIPDQEWRNVLLSAAFSMVPMGRVCRGHSGATCIRGSVAILLGGSAGLSK